MHYRTINLLSPEDLGATGTKVIDIRVRDVLSRISILFQPENGADGMKDHPAACISKIELVDGSEVLFSLSGKQVQALNFYQMGRMPWNYIAANADRTQGAQFNINFGRRLWDTELAFDPKKFINPQLLITFDETASQADTEKNTCRIWAYAFDEAEPEPTGFIRQTEQYSYGITAGGKQYIGLPTEMPVREIYVRTQKTGEWFANILEHFKLSEENGKRVPLDAGYELSGEIVKELYGWVYEQAQLPAVTDQAEFNTAVSEYAWFDGLVPTENVNVQGLPYAGGTHRYAAGVAGGRVFASLRGVLPHGVCPMLNLMADDPTNWYQVQKLGELELILSSPTGAPSDQIVEIITEQQKKYAE